MIYYASSTGEQEVNGHEKKDCQDRRGEMHGLRAVRERLPRGRDCDGGRKGEARQGACHEGAIAMVDGKAKLVKDDYCDGMGDCLPECPAGAIKIVEREAAAYDEMAVQERKMAKMQEQMKSGVMALHPEGHTPPPGGCPGKAMRQFNRVAAPLPTRQDNSQLTTPNSQLFQWPCQIRLVPVKAPFFQGAKLLIAAIRELPSGVHARQGDDCRMPQARSR